MALTYPGFLPSTYINEKEKKSYPIGIPSPGYDATGKAIPVKAAPVANSKYTPLFANQTPSASPAVQPAPAATRSKYIDPKTGTYFKTAEEYGNYVATKIPVASDVAKYAGDAITNPDQSATALQGTARNLNNSRNDIAVGATDPYSAGNKSGIAYSPQELSAIEKAYAGIYDPALNDVFARLKTKQDEDKAAADSKQKLELMAQQHKYDLETAAQNNAYDVALKYNATTGAKKEADSSDLFTQTQLNNGASNAGMSIDGFSKIDTDLQNFYVNPPNDIDPDSGKSYPMNKTLDNLIKQAKAGETTISDAADTIEAMDVAEAVKHYYIDQLPLTDVEKQGYWSNIWSSIWGK